MLAVDRIRERVAAYDVDGLRHVLAALDDTDRAEVETWIRAGRRTVRTWSQIHGAHYELESAARTAAGWSPGEYWDGPVAAPDVDEEALRTSGRAFFEYHEVWGPEWDHHPSNEGRRRSLPRELSGLVSWMRVLTAVACCSPAHAARECLGADVQGWGDSALRPQAVEVAAERGEAWCQEFIDTLAATKVSVGEELSDHAGSEMAWVAMLLSELHDLRCPPVFAHPRAYLPPHMDYHGGDRRVRTERRMPEVIYLLVADGSVTDLADISERLPGLIEDKIVDRGRLIAVCLAALTANQRVSAQRAVAKMLDAVCLEPSEIPGGLTYLTGVIATCDGAVGKTLLPRACALVVATGQREGLLELTSVFAARKERQQKQMLLTWLRAAETQSRLEGAAVLAALDVLDEGAEDARLARGIAAARAHLVARDPQLHALEGSAPSVEGQPAEVGGSEETPMGLWDMTLDPGPERQWRPWQSPNQIPWTRHLYRSAQLDDQDTEFAIDQFLREIAADGPHRFIEVCQGWRRDGTLALTHVGDLLEPAFLAGGLSVAWPAGLVIADDVASAGKTWAGFADLIRLLHRYAAEIPRGVTLPTHLADLARRGASPRATVTEQEVYGLAVAMGDLVAQGLATPAPPPADASRGLWELCPRGPILPLLLQPGTMGSLEEDDRNVAYHLEIGHGAFLNYSSPPDARHVQQRDSTLLQFLATNTQTSSADEVRARVAQIPRRDKGRRGPAARALDLWLDGTLTPAARHDLVETQRATLRTARLGLDSVVFAWMAEQLCRLDTFAGLLSHPGRSDGVIEVEDLTQQVRLLAGLGTVGPLDLLLALTRLVLPNPAHDFTPPSQPPGTGGASPSTTGSDAAGHGTGGDPRDARLRTTGRPFWTQPATERLAAALGALQDVELWTEASVMAPGVKPFDVVPVIRDWIEAGGLGAAAPRTGEFPIDLSLFGDVTHQDLCAGGSGAETGWRVWPLDRRLPQQEQWMRGFAPYVERVDGDHVSADYWAVLVTGLGAQSYDQDARARELVQLSRFDGFLDPEVTSPATVTLVGKTIPITEMAHRLGWLFERGAIRALWPVALAVATTATGITPKPAGLSTLFATLVTYAPEVPPAHREVPSGLLAFAASSGRSKSHQAARDLLHALGHDTSAVTARSGASA